MAEIQKISKAKLFMGIMYKDENVYKKIIKQLEKKFGAVEQESFTYPFNFTNYYDNQMSKDLLKKFIVFKKLINRNKLADIKIFTNNLENKFKNKQKRTINLDPGYLTSHNLILASAKERPHKVYLNKGIFGDLTLLFKKNTCITLRNTFPDFRDEKIQKFFCELRNKVKKELCI